MLRVGADGGAGDPISDTPAAKDGWEYAVLKRASHFAENRLYLKSDPG